MINAVRGNITNLRVNCAGSRPATKLLAAAATSAAALLTSLSSMLALPIVIARSIPPALSVAAAKRVQTNVGHRPPATKSP
jgi:hypothetical protein